MDKMMAVLLVCSVGFSCNKSQTVAGPVRDTGLGKLDLPLAVSKDAVAVAHFRMDSAFMQQIASFSYLGAPDPAADQKLIDDLSAYVKEKTGLETSKLSRITIIVSAGAKPQIAIVLEDTRGSLTGKQAGSHRGTPLVRLDDPNNDPVVAAQLKASTIVGDLEAVKAALDARQSKDKRLAPDSVLGKLLAEHGTDAALIVAVDATRLPPDFRLIAERMGIDSGVAAVGSKISIVVQGQKEGLQKLQAMITVFSRMFVKQVSDELAKAKEQNQPASVTFAMIGLHHAKRIVAAVAPKLDGNRLTMQTTVRAGDPAVFVGIIGILSAVAIPQFMKYIKTAKTTEALTGLRRLTDAVVAYVAENGKLPASVGPTPPLGTCCAQGGKCTPDPKLWRHPTWQALGFSLYNPHYYSYSIEVKGDTFTVRAEGDLDCDGDYSTFETVNAMGARRDPLVYRKNELE